MKESIRIRYREFPSKLAVGAAALLTLAACGEDEPASSSSSEVGTTASVGVIEHPLTFNYLGANSSIIMVYPGYTEAAEDGISNGEFNHGDVVSAICRATGREVTSAPPEEHRTSDQWVGIGGTDDEEQFATLVYADMDAQDLEALPLCD